MHSFVHFSRRPSPEINKYMADDGNGSDDESICDQKVITKEEERKMRRRDKMKKGTCQQ